jgi:16S rRNA (cytosine967-C5)-methyltransferase
LREVLVHRRPLDLAFESHPATLRLAPRDRAFARLLAATTLRRLGEIDRVLARLTAKPPAGVAAILLRLGLAQLLFLGTPAHAAVFETVALARRRLGGGLVPLINAVLRRAAADAPRLLNGTAAPRLNTPPWLWQRWCSAFGEEVARRIAEAHLVEPPLDLTARDDAAAVAAMTHGTVLATGTVRLAATGAVAELPGYGDGAWWVQDAAAALPVRLFGPLAGRRIIDLCAAPGGKTLQLAAAGARVTAVDRSPHRLARVAANLERCRLSAELIAADGTAWRPAEPVDGVLVDVPCTATGTIRRHPDIAWLKSAADLAALVPLQQALLTAALAMVRPGGTIVYCSCSLEAEEGGDQIARLLASGAPVRRRPITAAEVGGVTDLIDADGNLRTLPHHLAAQGGIDGFFAARLDRL